MRAYHLGSTVVSALLLAACGGGGGSSPPPAVIAPPPSPTPIPFAISGPTPFVAGCDGVAANGTLYVDAEVEPHVAANPAAPLNLVGTWQHDRWSNGGARGVMAAASFDGGLSWSRSLPAFTRCAGGEWARASDPWVAIGPTGVVYLMVIGLNGTSFSAGSSNAMLVARSVDGGRSWSAPATLIRDGDNAFNDKNTITADPTRANLAYAVWDRLVPGGGPLILARTTDAGLSWEAPRVIYDPGASRQTLGAEIAVLPSGVLVCLYNEINNANGSARLRVLRSEDQGITWSAPITVAAWLAVGARDPQTGAAIRDGATLPQLAVAPDGQLYAVWQDSRFSSGTIDGIALARSDDGGLSWSAPFQVNGAPAAQAFTPQIHVRADGTIGLTYYDLRANTADSATLPTELWLAHSRDSGQTWSETRVAGPFDLNLAANANGLFLGDYTGLTSSNGRFVPLYAQTSNSTANRSDIAAQALATLAASATDKAALAAAADYRARPSLPAWEPDAAAQQAVAENLSRQLAARRLGGP